MRTTLTILSVVIFFAASATTAQNVPPPTSNGTQTPNADVLSNQYVVGQGSFSTIQSAISAAGASGSAVIPPDYAGRDFFSSNPSGIRIDDRRPWGATYVAGFKRWNLSPPQVVNVKDFGAVCNGLNDDTAAINAALAATFAWNTNLLANENLDVELPQGTCQITAPLKMGIHGSLTGQGDASKLWANYAAWRGSDHNAIEITATAALPGSQSIAERKLSDFTIFGSNNATIPDTTAIVIQNTANVYSPTEYAISAMSLDHIHIAAFDTGILAEDFKDSVIESVTISNVRRGIALDGQVLDVQISHGTIQIGSWGATSTHTSTTGLSIEVNHKYGAGCGNNQYCAPQDIVVHDSTIIAFDNLIYDQQCVQLDIHDNALDSASRGPVGNGGSGVLIGPLGIAGGLWIKNNWIGVNGANAYGVQSTGIQGNGLWIEDNYFFPYIAPTTSSGIALTGASFVAGVHIVGNTFGQQNGIGFEQDIDLKQPVVYSEIRNNFGIYTGQYMINLSGLNGLTHTNLIVDGNSDSDRIPVIHNDGSATGYTTGINKSPVQVTGTYVASGSGCSITAGALGNSCSATVHNRVAFPDANYQVTGCAVVGASDHVVVSTVAAPSNGAAFSVAEIALNATATGGGTINCTVVHN
jgi:hypothetical protein